MENYNENAESAKACAYLFFASNHKIRQQCINELISTAPRFAQQYLIPIDAMLLDEENDGGYHFAFYSHDDKISLGKLRLGFIEDLTLIIEEEENIILLALIKIWGDSFRR